MTPYMPTFDLAAAPPAWMPAFLLHGNVLDFVMAYVAVVFVISLGLRLRLYWSVYGVAKYFADSCPHVFRLHGRHLLGLVQNGIVPMALAYGVVFLLYFAVARFAFPNAALSLAQLQAHPGTLAFCAMLFGATAAIDVAMMLQVAKIDVPWVKEQLEYAERWLSGRLTRTLDVLGRWNPIRYYADMQTRLALSEFNALFRHSLALMIFQTAARLALVATLLVVVARLRLLHVP
jgi:hypothetical protein